MFLSQCNAREIRAAFPGESEHYGVQRFPAFGLFFRCAVFSCFHSTFCEACSFTTDGYGIFTVRTNVGVPYTQRGFRHKQVCTRVDSGGHKHCPARGSNLRPSDLNCDSPTSELRPYVSHLPIFSCIPSTVSSSLAFLALCHLLWHPISPAIIVMVSWT